ncbi:MAG: flagellar basal body rod protein FlgB, partial [Treponema sp.]|nr:flagellar basal body rod protein FlgB [Treponema sp.]MCR5045339.1 flagellar basal body rod protein FlgB [Treponema sp.]
MNSFNRSIDLLQKALDVNTLRYQVTANNIANAEVPNFKRSSVNFESELKRAFESEENARNSFDLKRTDSRHFSIHNVMDWQEVKPRRVVDWNSTENANGNSVDVETEAMN